LKSIFILNRFSHVRLSEEEINKFLQDNEEFMFDLQKTNGKTNMDDYFYKYLQEKNKLLDEKNMDLKLPFQTVLPNNLIPVNVQTKFASNIQNNNMPNINPNIHSQMNNMMNNQNNLKINIPNIFSNSNFSMSYNNQNMQNFNKIVLQQNQQRLQQQSNINMNFNNLHNMNSFPNNSNLIGLKNMGPVGTGNFISNSIPIQNILNSNQQQIMGFNNIQGFQNGKDFLIKHL